MRDVGGDCVERVDEPVEIPLTALRRRESDVFARLVDQHTPVVLGLCQSMGLRGADIDDAAAEVFAAVWRALPSFEGRAALATWIYRIACRLIPRVRARRSEATENLPLEPADASQPNPLHQIESAETYRRIWDAVATLDEREAMAIELHYRQDFSIERIAEVLGCPGGTVKTLLFRGRQKLREKLQRQEIGI